MLFSPQPPHRRNGIPESIQLLEKHVLLLLLLPETASSNVCVFDTSKYVSTFLTCPRRKITGEEEEEVSDVDFILRAITR